MARDGSGVKKASASSIEITFQYRGVRCRERLKLPPTKDNIKRAKLHKAAVEDAILKGTFDYATTFPDSPRADTFSDSPRPTVWTVADYLHHWLDIKRQQLHSSSVDGYRKIIDGQIIPALGGIILHQLTRPHVRDWISSSKVSNKTLSNLLSPLRKALQDATDDGIIESNPIAGWKYRKREAPKPKKHKDPFSADEQAAILGKLEGQGRNLVQFLFWSGVRTSEAVGLEWRDIDWVGRTVTISRALTQAASEAETPKTNAGARTIKLLLPALEALTHQKQYTFLGGGAVFHNPRTSEPWDGDQAIRKTLWTPALKRGGVRYRNPYQTRHTFASMMISSGENIKWLSNHLGHSDMITTLRTYSDWLPDADPEAGSRAVSVFSPRL